MRIFERELKGQLLMVAVKNRRVQATIVHRPVRSGAALHAVAPGVRAVASDEFLSAL